MKCRKIGIKKPLPERQGLGLERLELAHAVYQLTVIIDSVVPVK